MRDLLGPQRRHEGELFPFLDHPEVPSANNHAKRQILPAVMVRKNSEVNGRDDGAETQLVLISFFRTMKQRGRNPFSAILDAVRTDLRTGERPPIPSKIAELSERLTDLVVIAGPLNDRAVGGVEAIKIEEVGVMSSEACQGSGRFRVVGLVVGRFAFHDWAPSPTGKRAKFFQTASNITLKNPSDRAKIVQYYPRSRLTGKSHLLESRTS